MSAPNICWHRLETALGTFPRPRHGHRAVATKDMMLVFGGGNEGIVDELHVYRSSKCAVSLPSATGGTLPLPASADGFCKQTAHRSKHVVTPMQLISCQQRNCTI